MEYIYTLVLYARVTLSLRNVERGEKKIKEAGGARRKAGERAEEKRETAKCKMREHKEEWSSNII